MTVVLTNYNKHHCWGHLTLITEQTRSSDNSGCVISKLESQNLPPVVLSGGAFRGSTREHLGTSTSLPSNQL